MPIDLDLVLSLLHYEPATGVFTWKRGPRAGLRAGSVDKTAGYEQIGIDGKLYRSHRLAWLYVHGSWPAGQIDHINGVRDDNRMANLRDASSDTNNQNRKGANKNNGSGLLGAHFDARTGRYMASIMKKRRQIFIGRFDTAEQAHAAHLAKRRELFDGSRL